VAAVDSFEEAGKDAAGGELDPASFAGGQEGLHGLFPADGLDDLIDEELFD
jgi:hypothetical protein